MILAFGDVRVVLGVRSFGMAVRIATVTGPFGFTVERVVAAAKPAIAETDSP